MRKQAHIIMPNIDENYLEENKAYVFDVKKRLKLEYNEVLFCKSKDNFYFLPMDRFLTNLIPYQGDHNIKIIKREIIEDIWNQDKEKIKKKYKIDGLNLMQEYMYVFMHCLNCVEYQTIGLKEFEEEIIKS